MKVEPATMALALTEDFTVTRMSAWSVTTDIASISSLEFTVIFVDRLIELRTLILF
jgi:hypothetical protein